MNEHMQLGRMWPCENINKAHTIRQTYYTRALGTDADSYSIHLKASVVQLFEHSFGFKVTILIVKRVKEQ